MIISTPELTTIVGNADQAEQAIRKAAESGAAHIAIRGFDDEIAARLVQLAMGRIPQVEVTA
ncbi:MAG: hypothetical protein E6R14_06500 [Thermomicrobiales bacterium]|jgi:hypothetical protein|nr:MAG: hypothetical protein E6R14_06500 [Thermomicrobiales bacterium]